MSVTATLVVLSGIVASTALAGNGGSGYSRHGLGDLRTGISGRGAGMGGVGIALFSPGVVDPLNPATWAASNRTLLSITGLYEGYAASDDVSSTYLADAAFSGVMLAVPLISRWGVVLGAGITPLSRVNYDIVTPASQSGYDYSVRYRGSGGLSVGHLGISAMPDSNLFLGVKLNYYFGTIENTINQTFTPAQYTNAEDIRLTRFDGIGGTFGLVFSGLRSLLGLPPGRSLNLGFVVSTASDLTSAEERYFTYVAPTLTTRDTLFYPEGKTKLPLGAGGGIAYAADRVTLAADLTYQNWNAFSVDGAIPGDLRDSYRFGFGGELIPKKESSAPFFQRLAYRAGFFYDASYYNVAGEPVNELGLTGGFGIPVVGDTRLHFAAAYSFRGTTDRGLQKDRILRFTLTLSAGELWFIHPQEE